MESSSSNAIAHLLSASQKLDPVSIHDPPPLPPPPANGTATSASGSGRPQRYPRATHNGNNNTTNNNNNNNNRRSQESGEDESNEDEEEDEDDYADETQQNSPDRESPGSQSHRQQQQRMPLPLHLLHPTPPAHIHHPPDYDQSQSQSTTAPNGQASANTSQSYSQSQSQQTNQSQTQTTNPTSASSSYILDPTVMPGLPPIPPDVLPAHITGPVAHLQLHHSAGQLSAPPAVPNAASASQGAGGRRGKRHTNDEEWNRQRKDNHKEVERRRRGNINDGINELARIIPQSGNGEKAKGAILHRAVSYIHQLKDNEARNIEKWTLEKLLMDQAMADLQGQVEELRRRYDEERDVRINLEREMSVLKSGSSTEGGAGEVGNKRPRVD